MLQSSNTLLLLVKKMTGRAIISDHAQRMWLSEMNKMVIDRDYNSFGSKPHTNCLAL
jgi:hypothetical protein